jgi:hypothetical protein
MKLWPASNAFLALLLSLSALSAAEPTLTLKSPIAQSVLQRQSANIGRVEISGEVHGMDQSYVSPVVEIRVDSGAWQRLTLSSVERNRTDTTFTGAVELAKGMHTLEVRAVRDGQPLASAPSVKFGIGEVIVVTGQSNSANHGAVKTKATSDQVFTLTPKGTWQPCADPQPGASGGGGSILPALGDELQKRLGVPIGFIPCGIGATSVREWLPTGVPFPNPPTIVSRVRKTADGPWEADGKAYAMLVTRMRSVPSFRAVLWHQGESDANQKDTTRTLSGKLYAEYLTKLIAGANKDSQRNSPWFVAQVSYHGPTDVGSEDIRSAQAGLWKDKVALEGPDSDALRGPLRDNGGNGVHFSGEGLKAHAHAWAEKLVPWIEAQR